MECHRVFDETSRSELAVHPPCDEEHRTPQSTSAGSESTQSTDRAQPCGIGKSGTHSPQNGSRVVSGLPMVRADPRSFRGRKAAKLASALRPSRPEFSPRAPSNPAADQTILLYQHELEIHKQQAARLRCALARAKAQLREMRRPSVNAREQDGPLSFWAGDAREAASLTPRQREVMVMVLEGHPSKNIAADLGISRRTVENHRAAIMKKTGSKSLPALGRFGFVTAQSAAMTL